MVSPAHFIPANIKKDILEGKDVNLASLLIAAQDVSENKSFSCGEVSVVLKTKDPRLSRKLSVPEFVLAFGIFRDIICAVSPGRREELDLYLHKVVDLAHKYGGTIFYDYHRSFAAKVAATWAQFQVVSWWGAIDMELFCRHFAGQKSPVCTSCQSSAHTTAWCSNVEASSQVGPSRQVAGGSAGTLGQVDKLGRPIRYLGKAQLCNNYNYAGCNFNQCRLLHVCANCFRAHPKSACLIKPISTA